MEQMKTLTVNGETYEVTDNSAVHKTEQILSEEEKQQARKNIDAVGKGDFATTGTAGVVRCGEGLHMSSSSGKINLNPAEQSHIKARTTAGRAIVPTNLDYAVKTAICDNKGTMSDAEKLAACGWLGTAVIVANADGTLSVKLADGSIYKIAATKEA